MADGERPLDQGQHLEGKHTFTPHGLPEQGVAAAEGLKFLEEHRARAAKEKDEGLKGVRDKLQKTVDPDRLVMRGTADVQSHARFDATPPVYHGPDDGIPLRGYQLEEQDSKDAKHERLEAAQRLVDVLSQMRSMGGKAAEVAAKLEGLVVGKDGYSGVDVTQILPNPDGTRSSARVVPNKDGTWKIVIDARTLTTAPDITLATILADEISHTDDMIHVVRGEGKARTFTKDEATKSEIKAKRAALEVYREARRVTGQKLSSLDEIDRAVTEIEVRRAAGMLSEQAAEARIEALIHEEMESRGYGGRQSGSAEVPPPEPEKPVKIGLKRIQPRTEIPPAVAPEPQAEVQEKPVKIGLKRIKPREEPVATVEAEAVKIAIKALRAGKLSDEALDKVRRKLGDETVDKIIAAGKYEDLRKEDIDQIAADAARDRTELMRQKAEEQPKDDKGEEDKDDKDEEDGGPTVPKGGGPKGGGDRGGGGHAVVVEEPTSPEPPPSGDALLAQLMESSVDAQPEARASGGDIRDQRVSAEGREAGRTPSQSELARDAVRGVFTSEDPVGQIAAYLQEKGISNPTEAARRGIEDVISSARENPSSVIGKSPEELLGMIETSAKNPPRAATTTSSGEYVVNPEDVPLRFLFDVGKDKPMGYLADDHLAVHGMSVEQAIAEGRKRGLEVTVLKGNDAIEELGEVNRTVVYWWDKQALEDLLQQPEHRRLLEANGWPTDPQAFLEKTFSESARPKTELFDLVADAMGDKGNFLRSDSGVPVVDPETIQRWESDPELVGGPMVPFEPQRPGATDEKPAGTSTVKDSEKQQAEPTRDLSRYQLMQTYGHEGTRGLIARTGKGIDALEGVLEAKYGGTPSAEEVAYILNQYGVMAESENIQFITRSDGTRVAVATVGGKVIELPIINQPLTGELPEMRTLADATLLASMPAADRQKFTEKIHADNQKAISDAVEAERRHLSKTTYAPHRVLLGGLFGGLRAAGAAAKTTRDVLGDAGKGFWEWSKYSDEELARMKERDDRKAQKQREKDAEAEVKNQEWWAEERRKQAAREAEAARIDQEWREAEAAKAEEARRKQAEFDAAEAARKEAEAKKAEERARRDAERTGQERQRDIRAGQEDSDDTDGQKPERTKKIKTGKVNESVPLQEGVSGWDLPEEATTDHPENQVIIAAPDDEDPDKKKQSKDEGDTGGSDGVYYDDIGTTETHDAVCSKGHHSPEGAHFCIECGETVSDEGVEAIKGQSSKAEEPAAATGPTQRLEPEQAGEAATDATVRLTESETTVLDESDRK